jgi:hypothetical protein
MLIGRSLADQLDPTPQITLLSRMAGQAPTDRQRD